MALNRAVPGPEEPFELSWELFGELCRALAVKVGREYDPEIIIGMPPPGSSPVPSSPPCSGASSSR